DPATNQLLETGHYRLTGLKNGNYYLMLTFDIIQLKQQPNKNIAFKLAAIQRPMPGVSKMRQIWYGEVVVETDNFRFLQFQNIPDGAITVSVNEPNDTPNINFSFLQSAIDFNDTKALPTEFGLESVFPNPFNPEATIRYAVPYASQITIEIFDILGRKVATVLDQKQSSGWHTVQWNGRNDQHEAVTSGIYIARLKAADQVSTRKMILLR
ncbi:MAG: T9SS type A sorting domain-containing protein, partial [Calditrichales bacterium]